MPVLKASQRRALVWLLAAALALQSIGAASHVIGHLADRLAPTQSADKHVNPAVCLVCFALSQAGHGLAPTFAMPPAVALGHLLAAPALAGVVVRLFRAADARAPPPVRIPR